MRGRDWQHSLRMGLLLPLILFPHSLPAKVNLHEGALIKVRKDVDGRGWGSPLILERIYSSRSLYQGSFGYGWCSNLEWKLNIKDSTIDRCLGFKPAALKKQGKNWIWRNGGTEFVFSADGNLKGWKNRLGQVTIDRNPEKRPIALRDDQGRRLHMVWDDRRILGLHGPWGDRTYEYAAGNLVRERESRLTREYAYDHLHNLIRIIHPDLSTESFKYDSEMDRLMARQRPDGCQELYNYERLSPLRLRGTATELCPRSPPSRFEVELVYERDSRGQLLLKDIKRTTGRGRS